MAVVDPCIRGHVRITANIMWMSHQCHVDESSMSAYRQCHQHIIAWARGTEKVKAGRATGRAGGQAGRRAGGQAGSASASASASAYVVLQQSTVASIKTHSLGVHPAIVMIEEGHRKQNHDSAAAEGANHSKVIKQVPENGSANPDCRNLSIETHGMTSHVLTRTVVSIYTEIIKCLQEPFH